LLLLLLLLPRLSLMKSEAGGLPAPADEIDTWW
jgi:hypothetical protein